MTVFLNDIARSTSLSTGMDVCESAESTSTSASQLRMASVICLPYSLPGSMESGAIQQGIPASSSVRFTALACSNS